MSLWNDFQTNSGRTIHKWAHYFPAYERHFAPFVNRPLLFLEIGVGDGGSLQMWRRFFGPHASIVGIDNRSVCLQYADSQISIRIGDQSDVDFLDALLAEFGIPDVVLDDGSHVMSDVCTTFKHLYPKLPRHGVYAIEDLHTAYWPEYGGGHLKDGSFIEYAKTLIDELNADVSHNALPTTEFKNTTNSISFYNSMAFFERGQPLSRYSEMKGSTGHYNR
ncbi:class I SAM-dependent methyltransferase [Methylobacterium sp. WL2]|uniref:class I SAM-dependent methyltransferase n=1 Tax=Methylobacterium sp. WL2 TaxID=2603902 RepID=UPI0011CB8BE1|nr:class I SAM-dependent methyltransferase [Methylobacterium sp. WL2]TXN56755.1 class I SAM-dependent methyltransferase [Methylobacterium sp. WL2]